MKVRRAVVGDEGILRELRLQALADAPDAFGSTYERELARTVEDWRRWLSPGVTFILDDSQGARGIVAAAHDATDASIVHLMAMWVHPEIRGSGAGDALVAPVVAWAQAEGARVVQLQVMESNLRARRFYERNGFRLTDRERVRERDGQVELQMERPADGTAPTGAARQLRSAGVYLHPAALILHAQGRVPAGFHLSIPPVFLLAVSPAPDVLGCTLREALAAYQPALPQPQDWRAHRAGFLRATGVRSWSQLEGLSRSCWIEEAQAGITFTPLRNGGSRGAKKGFQPFGASPIACPGGVGDEVLGQALFDALGKCE